MTTCVHRPPCPGCPGFGAPGLLPQTEARFRTFASELGVEPVIHVGNPFGYRVRARLSVRGSARRPRVGIFEEGSHRLVDIPECRVHHPLVNLAARALVRCMRSTGTTAYDEAAHRGLVRALQVVVERPTNRVQVSLVLNSTEASPGLELARAVEAELGPQLQGLFLNLHAVRSNVVLGRVFVHLKGAESTAEILGGARVFFPPGAFGQANLDLFERILSELQREVPEGQRIVEYHAGCGAIGLGLVGRSESYRFNELGEDSLRGLRLGIEALPIEHRARVSVEPGRAAQRAASSRGADLVIVDPPRKGLEPELLQALLEDGPERLIYLSCGFDSLLRDAAALAARYRASNALAYALFPFTPHIETLLVFERRRA